MAGQISSVSNPFLQDAIPAKLYLFTNDDFSSMELASSSHIL